MEGSLPQQSSVLLKPSLTPKPRLKAPWGIFKAICNKTTLLKQKYQYKHDSSAFNNKRGNFKVIQQILM